jgi:hypothetical protein
MIDPEIGKDVPHKQIGPAIGVANGVQDRAHDEKTKITQKNEFGIFCLIQGRSGIEMVDATSKTVLLAFASTFLLDFVLVVTGNVG